MNLATIVAIVGGLLAGGLLAAAVSASWWGRRLKASTERMTRLEQARQQADQQSAQLRKQLDQTQMEMAELRHQAARAKARADTPAPAAEEAQDLLLRESAFPPTMILPRKPAGAPADDPFPATMLVPRKPS